jgi:hypothetical protein
MSDKVQQFFNNPYIMTILKVAIVVYGVKLAPRLPVSVENMFQTTWFKIVGIALIIWLSSKDYQLAILVSIVFVLGINFVSGRGPLESFADFTPNYTPPNPAKLISPKAEIFPGCLNVTLQDLLNTFSGDAEKLQKTVRYTYQELTTQIDDTDADAKDRLLAISRVVGLPYDVELTDENAPLIATMLLMFGFKINGDCQNPHDNSQNQDIVLNSKDTVAPMDYPQENQSMYSPVTTENDGTLSSYKSFYMPTNIETQ